jgi:hypothetical protein
LGCSGYYVASDPTQHEMSCRGTADTVNNFRVAIRYGFWNGSNGFGWSKMYYYHNLWMAPALDVIHRAGNPYGPDTNRVYAEYHTNDNGDIDQYVFVVADIQEIYFQGVKTPDNKAVGVLTGYCENAAGAQEPECPDWVNSSL